MWILWLGSIDAVRSHRREEQVSSRGHIWVILTRRKRVSWASENQRNPVFVDLRSDVECIPDVVVPWPRGVKLARNAGINPSRWQLVPRRFVERLLAGPAGNFS